MALRRHQRRAQPREGFAMNEPRIIKKYPNRRLYDTVESRYITLEDVRRLVLERVDFRVIDKRIDLIRSHDVGLQGVLSSYLEQILRLFLNQTPPSGDSAAVASRLATQNYQRWHNAQEEIFRTLIRAGSA
jgi:polyhydroxyalkanoate synthesis regulator protein